MRLDTYLNLQDKERMFTCFTLFMHTGFCSVAVALWLMLQVLQTSLDIWHANHCMQYMQ